MIIETSWQGCELAAENENDKRILSDLFDSIRYKDDDEMMISLEDGKSKMWIQTYW